MSSKKENIILEKAIFNSFGVTDEKESSGFNDELKTLTPDERKMVADFNNIASMLPLAAIKESNFKSPSDNAKSKIFEKISASQKKDAFIKKFSYIFSNSSEWLQHPVEGIMFKQLAVNEEKGYAMILMKVAPDTYYPAHHHHGAEECYVIDGDVYAQGKTLGPGDFHHADGGTDHEPLYTKNGCTVILVVDKDDAYS